MLFSEPKIPQYFRVRPAHHLCAVVSVLFSEPKIPQFLAALAALVLPRCFSALQRAENSSIRAERRTCAVNAKFQCSSASRKFLNAALRLAAAVMRALFQCSSASRKFLNRNVDTGTQLVSEFQCSSASRKFLNSASARCCWRRWIVSVLFSEPKIPQSSRLTKRVFWSILVSVLFSEPKIPQSDRAGAGLVERHGFQCSSASRKFLNSKARRRCWRKSAFQCSSASRKFLNRAP